MLALVLAVLARPFLQDLSCTAPGAGIVACAPDASAQPTPPYAVAYSQVTLHGSLMLACRLASRKLFSHCKISLNSAAKARQICVQFRTSDT